MSVPHVNAVAIIRGLKTHFGVESDDALAARIGVAKSTIATWRRRGVIPSKFLGDLERLFGLTAEHLSQQAEDRLRHYLLKQAYYFVLLEIIEALNHDGFRKNDKARLADDLAVIEPYLTRAIVKAASTSKYLGLHGATTFLLDLRSGELSTGDLAREAIADRRSDLGPEPRGLDDLTNPPTNREGSAEDR